MMVLLAAAFVPSGEKRSARNEGIGREPAAPSDAQAQDDSVQCGSKLQRRQAAPPFSWPRCAPRIAWRCRRHRRRDTGGRRQQRFGLGARRRACRGESTAVSAGICGRARIVGVCGVHARAVQGIRTSVFFPLWPWRCGSSTSLPAKVGRLPRRRFRATWLWWRPRRSSLADTPAGAMESCAAA